MNQNPYLLKKEVRKKIKEGWIPEGGVSIAIHSDNSSLFCQAMIKPDAYGKPDTGPK